MAPHQVGGRLSTIVAPSVSIFRPSFRSMSHTVGYSWPLFPYRLTVLVVSVLAASVLPLDD